MESSQKRKIAKKKQSKKNPEKERVRIKGIGSGTISRGLWLIFGKE
jgi:hypothetical protein